MILIIVGLLLALIVANALVAGLTAGAVALINLIPTTDFGYTLPIIVVCGIYTVFHVAQALIFIGTKRRVDKEFDRFKY